MKQILEKPKKNYNHCGKAFFNEYILLVISAIVVSYFNIVKNKIYQKKSTGATPRKFVPRVRPGRGNNWEFLGKSSPDDFAKLYPSTSGIKNVIFFIASNLRFLHQFPEVLS